MSVEDRLLHVEQRIEALERQGPLSMESYGRFLEGILRSLGGEEDALPMDEKSRAREVYDEAIAQAERVYEEALSRAA